jgi:iron(II)-dependent oxidoreductase
MQATQAEAARRGGREVLAAALTDSRARTLALLEAYTAALGDTLPVPYSPQLNPPLWEAGHVGWFQDWWIARNRQRDRASPATPSMPGRRAAWPGPTPCTTPAGSPTPALAPDLPDWPRRAPTWPPAWRKPWRCWPAARKATTGLYFYRLALFHEDMHGEAGVYMAQALDIPLPANAAPAPGARRKSPRCVFRRSPGRWAGMARASPSTTNWRPPRHVDASSRSTARS